MHLVIPDNAKIIGKSAFADCRELVSVIVSSGTSRISGNAFENCISLESITIPSKVKVLGKDIFQNCRKLKYILVSGNPEDMKAHGWLAMP